MTISDLIIITIVFVMSMTSLISTLVKKENGTISSTLITAGVTFVISALPAPMDKAIRLIAGILKTQIDNGDTGVNYWIRFICGLVLIALGIFLNYKASERIYVLNMYGISVQKDINDPKSIKDLHISEYKVKENVIDFVSFFNGASMDADTNMKICNQIKRAADNYVAKVKEQNETCFTGMAPIPYTVYAGTFLEGAKISRYFEYVNKDGKYYELSDASKRKLKKTPGLKPIFPEKMTPNASEVVLAISISHSISDNDLSQFSCDKVRLSLDEPMDNIIQYKQQLTNYKDEIIKTIETNIVKNYPNVKTIHIAASIPSCIAVEIGKSIGSKANRVPEIVVHHFISSSSPRYTFGVYVSGNNKGHLYEERRI